MPAFDRSRLGRKTGVSGGRVCLLYTGIPVAVIAERFAIGETLIELARDYDTGIRDIEAALRLVVAASTGRRGVRVSVERRMESMIPLQGA